MTKFSSLVPNKRLKSKTILTHLVIGNDEIENNIHNDSVEDYDNCLHIGHDSVYGDVFKLWDNKGMSGFVIAFGKKGSEFDNI